MLNARKINKILLISICFFSIFGSSNVAFAETTITYPPSSIVFAGEYIQCSSYEYSECLTFGTDWQEGQTIYLIGGRHDNESFTITSIEVFDSPFFGRFLYITPNIGSGEYDEGSVTFTTTNPATPTLTSGVLFGRSGESQQAIQNPVNMVASVGVATSGVFSSVFPYLMLSVGVITVFYITQKLAMTLSLKTKKKRGWTAEGATEHEVNKFKKKKRSRIKRGLPLE